MWRTWPGPVLCWGRSLLKHEATQDAVDLAREHRMNGRANGRSLVGTTSVLCQITQKNVLDIKKQSLSNIDAILKRANSSERHMQTNTFYHLTEQLPKPPLEQFRTNSPPSKSELAAFWGVEEWVVQEFSMLNHTTPEGHSWTLDCRPTTAWSSAPGCRIEPIES